VTLSPDAAQHVAAPPALPVRVEHAVAAGAQLADPTTRSRAPSLTTPSGSASAAPVRRDVSARDPDGDLALEARMLTDARAALMAGDAARALTIVRATRKLGTRALEPEELVLEARALSALGRVDEAAADELLLRRRYPDSALAR
jgi:hypothetical protein